MSTKAERASRAKHRVLPLKLMIRQRDGRFTLQIVDSLVRVPKQPGRASKRAAAYRLEEIS